MNAEQRCLHLSKGDEQFVFWYHEGQEADLLATLVDMADDPNSDFDWYDAAVLSFQMGKAAGQRREALAG